MLSVHLEANPILPAGKHQSFKSIFKERLSDRDMINSYARGGQLPKLNTTFSPQSSRGAKIIPIYGNSWRSSAQRRLGETNT
jgi:hypothetical protein